MHLLHAWARSLPLPPSRPPSPQLASQVLLLPVRYGPGMMMSTSMSMRPRARQGVQTCGAWHHEMLSSHGNERKGGQGVREAGRQAEGEEKKSGGRTRVRGSERGRSRVWHLQARTIRRRLTVRSARDPLTARPLSAAIRTMVSRVCVRVMVHVCVCIKEGASEDLACTTFLQLFELEQYWSETASILYQGIKVGLEGLSGRSRLLVNALHHLPFAKPRYERQSQAHKGNTCAARHALRVDPLPPPPPTPRLANLLAAIGYRQ
jgi:hypothetical protein